MRKGAAGSELGTQQTQLHLVGRAGVLGVLLEHVPLKPLHQPAILLEGLGSRVAEDHQAPVTLKESSKRPTDRMPRLGEVLNVARCARSRRRMKWRICRPLGKRGAQ